LALWFGVPVADLELILPNIRRFWVPGSTTPPLGAASVAPVAARRA
jgi:hypothetical protein